MFQSNVPKVVMVWIFAFVKIWICVERINVIITDKLLYRLTKLADIVDATDASRCSHTTRQSRQQKRGENSDDGDDDQKFRQRER